MSRDLPSPPPTLPVSRSAGPTLRHRADATRFALRRTGLVQVGVLLRDGFAAALAIVAARFLAWHPRASLALRRRAVDRLVAGLGALKGPFAKVGQFASLRLDVLPAELRERLATLQDRVPPLAFAEIRPLVEAELGAPLEERFRAFDPEPIGAASVAQAHRAELPAGQAVVVKVQYPWLAETLRADLAVLRALHRAASALVRRRRVDRRRLFDEFASGVREELDFRREADVAEEVAANLAGDDRVVVPQVVRSHCAGRVLTMAHHPAVPIDDGEGLRRLGVDPREVLEVLARAYAKQVFVDGLFHADPHPGNLFVVDEPTARERPRILFVDFGLSKRLAPELRREMRRGIHALLSRDLEGFLAGMERLDMITPGERDGVKTAVESMFERIRSDAAAPLAMSGDRVLALKDDAKRLLEETEGLQLPNELLLYAKTLSYLFGLGEQLAPEVDLMRISVPYLLRFLAEPEETRAVTSGPGAAPARG